MTTVAILVPILTTLALIALDHAIRRHYDNQLAQLLVAQDRQARNRLARFHAEWGCDGTCGH
jgi:demethoxyubiquinone hydroxylase (CLK1/Coq7/Cat5 family)